LGLGFGFGYKKFWVLGINIFGFEYNTQPNNQTQNPTFSGYKRLPLTIKIFFLILNLYF